jgi:hypothetical protein
MSDGGTSKSLPRQERRPYRVVRPECILNNQEPFPADYVRRAACQEAVVTSEAEQYRELARELHFMARNLPPGEHRSALPEGG